MVLLVSYDLYGKERPSAYADVKRQIQQNATAYMKPLYSQWLIMRSAEPLNTLFRRVETSHC